MKRFITSDLHINHKNMISYCPDSRGHFTSVEEMNEAIVNNINSVVSDDDELYILGDIGFGRPTLICDYLKRINGAKHIIHGNHDTKLIASSEFQQNKGIMGIVEDTPYKMITHVVDDVKNKVVMFHFPIEAWDGCHNGYYHFHGHRHTPNGEVLTKRRKDIGVDSNFMMPYDMTDLIRYMSHLSPTYDGHHNGDGR